MKTVYFVRHGETEGNVNKVQQSPDEPLNAKGLHQAAVLADRVQHLTVDRVMSSSMYRAEQTAAVIAQAIGLPYETHDVFQELRSPTSLHGEGYRDDPASPVETYIRERDMYASDPAWHFEDGENFTDLLERVKQGLAYVAEQPEEHIVVVSHGRYLRTLTGYVVTEGACTAAHVPVFARSFKATNTAISVMHYDDERWSLLTWNDHAHFADT